jgi:hypothetical protein
MTPTILIRGLLAAGLLLAVAGVRAASVPAATPRPVTLDGIIHPDSDDTLAFTPDGNTVFFDRSEGSRKTIMVAHKAGGRWSPPEVAGFSGRWFDQDPVIAPDGSLYFIRWDTQARAMHTWRAARRDGHYLPPVRAGLGDPAVSTHDPAVAPNQSFIVFDYGKTKGGLGRLCIAFREGDHWGKPVDLGDTVNKDMPWGSHVAPDGRSIYFTGQSGLWMLDLRPWLRQHAASR